MFKEASRIKLRFTSRKGDLTVEDLWDLPLTELNTIAKGLSQDLKDSKEENFLEEKTAEDLETKLGFDIVLDIIKTKQAVNKKKREAVDRKEKKEKIMALISEKKDEGLKQKSVEELEKELADL